VRVAFDGAHKISFPRRTTAPDGDVPWVSEGSPISVRQ
jgi:hypothetical protein